MSLPPKNSAKQREHDRARILTLLLADDALTDSLLDPQGVQDAELRDQTSELTRLVNSLPAADVADALESLPPDERHVLWQQVDPERHGQILVEASETVWDSLISGMSDKALLQALRSLDIDDQIYLGQYLPRNLMGRLLTSMAPDQRDRVREVIRYGKHTVGAMMDFELITVRADISLATVQRYLRQLGKIPANTDKLFVTDRRNRLQGELPLTTVLLHKPETRVEDVMEKDPVTFDPEDNDEAAARTFERDDLVSAAVVDGKGKLMGRLTVAEVVDLVYEERHRSASHGGDQRGRRRVRPCRQGGQDPLGLAGAEPLHRLRGVAGDRPVRAHHLPPGGAGGPDAHRRRERRQHRQPDHHHDSASAGAATHSGGQPLFPVSARAGSGPD